MQRIEITHHALQSRAPDVAQPPVPSASSALRANTRHAPPRFSRTSARSNAQVEKEIARNRSRLTDNPAPHPRLIS